MVEIVADTVHAIVFLFVYKFSVVAVVVIKVNVNKVRQYAAQKFAFLSCCAGFRHRSPWRHF